jgi:hypothetical protein
MAACASTVWLERLISIRIWTKDTGQHILAKQRLIGVGSNPFTTNEKLTMAPGNNFWRRQSFYLGFWPRSYCNCLQVFLPFRSFFTLKTNLYNSPEQSRKFSDG